LFDYLQHVYVTGSRFRKVAIDFTHIGLADCLIPEPTLDYQWLQATKVTAFK
jgi:hypothetical protein